MPHWFCCCSPPHWLHCRSLHHPCPRTCCSSYCCPSPYRCRFHYRYCRNFRFHYFHCRSCPCCSRCRHRNYPSSHHRYGDYSSIRVTFPSLSVTWMRLSDFLYPPEESPAEETSSDPVYFLHNNILFHQTAFFYSVLNPPSSTFARFYRLPIPFLLLYLYPRSPATILRPNAPNSSKIINKKSTKKQRQY